MCQASEHGCPFTLTCAQCDAGGDVTSYDQALIEGWGCVNFAPDLPMANFVGVYPDCRAEDERIDAARIAIEVN